MTLWMITMMTILVCVIGSESIESTVKCDLDSEEWNDIRGRNEDTESLYDMATGDLKEYMHSVRTKLGQVKHYQFMQGADMSRVSQTE